MNRCCFCRDDIENHHGNLPYPDGTNSKWLCGTCVQYAVVTDYLRTRAEIHKAVEAEVREAEKHAEELATGVETVGAKDVEL